MGDGLGYRGVREDGPGFRGDWGKEEEDSGDGDWAETGVKGGKRIELGISK